MRAVQHIHNLLDSVQIRKRHSTYQMLNSVRANMQTTFNQSKNIQTYKSEDCPKQIGPQSSRPRSAKVFQVKER